jgi:hypothetical protein
MAIRKDVDRKTEQMEKSVRVAEREYSKKMAELSRSFEVCPSLKLYDYALRLRQDRLQLV